MPNKHRNPYQERNWLQTLRTIYNLRILQVMLGLVIFSLVLYALDYFVSRSSKGILLWLKDLPLRALADACLTAFLVGITYEWIVRYESEAALSEIISKQIQIQQQAIIEEIPRALIINPEVMGNILKEERLEEILRAGLQVRLGDKQMGDDIYEGLLRKTLSYNQRWANYRFKATLSIIDDPSLPEIVRYKYYNATIDLRYDTKLTKNKFIFHCVTSIDDYNKSIRDPNYEFTWLFPPTTDEFPTIDTSVFDVKQITVDNIELNLNYSTDENGNLAIVCTNPDLSNLQNRIVTVYYRYVVKINKRGHLFMANVIMPTRNVVIELDYANTDIHFVNVLDFFVSAQLPKITYLPSKEKAHKVEIELNEWAFPKGGVAFVWVLAKEMNKEYLRPPSSFMRK